MGTPITAYVESIKDFPRREGGPRLPEAGQFWSLVEDGIVVAVTFLCPCGCGRECYTPVTDATKGQAKEDRSWLFSREASGRPTLSPSIRYLSGCKTHFNITDGKVVTHGDSGK